MKVFSGNANLPLAEGIGKYLGLSQQGRGRRARRFWASITCSPFNPFKGFNGIVRLTGLELADQNRSIAPAEWRELMA